MSQFQTAFQMKTVTLFLLALAFGFAHADTLKGYVVGVADGDTLTVLDANREQHKIRLSGIDAPEKAQAFGQRSKQSLATLAFNKNVTIEWAKRDRYGRIIGKILVDGGDINLEQVKTGMAWWYRDYAKEQPTIDRADYEQAEQQAKTRRLGLWIDRDPTPPWEWRRMKRAF